MPLRRASHAVYDCQYHLVWTPKRRRPVLTGSVGSRLGELFREIGDAYDIWIEELHVAEDHVHLFCSFVLLVCSARFRPASGSRKR